MAAKLFRRLKSGLGVVAFLYGAAFHFIALRVIVHESYQPPADRSFVDDPLTNLGVMISGGLFTSIAISWVLSKLPGFDFKPVRSGLCLGRWRRCFPQCSRFKR